MWQLRPLVTPIPQFDSIGAGLSGGQSGSWTHNVGANAKAVIIFGMWYSNTGSGNASVSFGGVGVPVKASNGGYGNTTWGGGSGYYTYHFAWAMLNPATGSVTGAYSIPGGTGWAMSINSITYNNVSSIGTGVSGYGAGTAASHTTGVTPSRGQLLAQGFAQNVGPTTGFTQYNQNQRWKSTAGYSLLIGDAPAAASVPFTALAPAAGPDWSSLVVPLAA
ncbi:hypothetical protein [Mycobacterium colombiense]|uniref:hypothetical protein n=1 Tax=Mycobacterium colombiense TaxID=339268 RepID=UPI00114DBA28|nr:hypothetical protein [Mycobacterium colombiense]